MFIKKQGVLAALAALANPSEALTCDQYQAVPGTNADDFWCQSVCEMNPAACPANLCRCWEPIVPKVCVSRTTAATDAWCNKNCNHVPAFCPKDFCDCGDGGPTYWSSKPGVPDSWCELNCNHVPSFCPSFCSNTTRVFAPCYGLRKDISDQFCTDTCYHSSPNCHPGLCICSFDETENQIMWNGKSVVADYPNSNAIKPSGIAWKPKTHWKFKPCQGSKAQVLVAFQNFTGGFDGLCLTSTNGFAVLEDCPSGCDSTAAVCTCNNADQLVRLFGNGQMKFTDSDGDELNSNSYVRFENMTTVGQVGGGSGSTEFNVVNCTLTESSTDWELISDVMTLAGSTANFKCAVGYELENNRQGTEQSYTRACDFVRESGTAQLQNATDGDCVKVECESYSAGAEQTADPASLALYDNNVTFTCNTGYELADESSTSYTRTCQADETLSGTSQDCQKVKCEGYSTGTNQAASPASLAYYDDTVTFTCDAGYELSDESSSSYTRTCQDSKSLDSSSQNCQKVKCPDPTAGTFQNTPTFTHPVEYEDVVTYNCQSGYRVVGTASDTTFQRECGQSKSYVEAEKTCELIPTTNTTTTTPAR